MMNYRRRRGNAGLYAASISREPLHSAWSAAIKVAVMEPTKKWGAYRG